MVDLDDNNRLYIQNLNNIMITEMMISNKGEQFQGCVDRRKREQIADHPYQLKHTGKVVFSKTYGVVMETI